MPSVNTRVLSIVQLFRDKPVVHNGVTLHFKGFAILKAVLDSLATKGLINATDVILTGCSAGGLATYLHADYVKTSLYSTTNYHAIADAGYILMYLLNV